MVPFTFLKSKYYNNVFVCSMSRGYPSISLLSHYDLRSPNSSELSVESLWLYEIRSVQDELNQMISNNLSGKSNSFIDEYLQVC